MKYVLQNRLLQNMLCDSCVLDLQYSITILFVSIAFDELFYSSSLKTCMQEVKLECV